MPRPSTPAEDSGPGQGGTACLPLAEVSSHIRFQSLFPLSYSAPKTHHLVNCRKHFYEYNLSKSINLHLYSKQREENKPAPKEEMHVDY